MMTFGSSFTHSLVYVFITCLCVGHWTRHWRQTVLMLFLRNSHLGKEAHKNSLQNNNGSKRRSVESSLVTKQKD